MKSKLKMDSLLRLLAAILMLCPPGDLWAQKDKVAAFKQALAQNQKLLAQYEWDETTIILMKGEEKSRTQKHCFYGPDGKVQKQQTSAPAQLESPGGLKGKIAAKKKGEITEYMQQAVELVHQYVPPDAQQIQQAKDSGKLALNPMGQGAVRLDFHDFVKPGDSMSLSIDTANMDLKQISVKSYLDSQEDAIMLDVNFAMLNDGVSYPAKNTLNAPAKKIQVVIENFNHQRMRAVTVASGAPQQGVQGAPPKSQQGQESAVAQMTPQQIDTLTGPIALYPDALIAQILTASTNFFELKSFAAWLEKSTALKGDALQDAAHAEGYDAAFVALAPFPQVVQMMAQKPDWTKQLGQAFTANKSAVFDSIQRLRAQAQAMGNLKSSSQQEVQTQTTSGGQQVIVIQPANPQVVYVPQYNPQVVYVQSAPPPSSTSAAGTTMVAFTAGVIIGAAASNNYYYGPYGWHGAAMYNEAWENQYDYANQRQDAYQQNSSQRQSSAQANQSQRQTTSQTNQASRQTSAEGMQSSAQANQATRQSSAQGMQSSAQANQATRQSSATSTTQANQAQRQSAASSSTASGQAASQRSGMSSGGFSGYQSGSATRSASSRGSSSRSSSRSGGSRSR